MLALLLLCMIRDVTSIHYGEDNDMISQLDKQKYINDIYRSTLDYRSDGEYYKKDDYTDDSNEPEPRRLFDWFKDIIKRNTSYRTNPNVVNERLRFREIERNLTDTLVQLSSVLNQILNIVKFSRQDDFRDINDHLQHPLDKSKHISKRDIADKDLETNKTESDNKNATTDNKSQSLNDSSGRRAMMGSQVLVTTDEVKDKLFNYIDEGFTEIKNQINSLKPVKSMFSNDMRYGIGYIVANIDTLDGNMKNLKQNMEKNQYTWSDKKILNLYDIVKKSNRAVNNLIEVLKESIENSLSADY